MNNTVIKVENVSKQYRLGLVGTGTVSHDLNRWWARIRGKEDPNLLIGEENDRAHKGESDYVWALKDINFEVKRGDVLGIIGRNGAGKSTLLKILSRVTAPTTGRIRVNGRIASLLEVGTGFHPELTGRENIYLNGAINGMTKADISRKLDEIVEFSGCERYIDTPVKRYSSGMKVRLGFSVAAHLEPDILIVDEVLAVGDAEFQKKCIGKMQDVAGHGRTVLFVSHNLSAVRTLCHTGVEISQGRVAFAGDINTVLAHYTDQHFSISLDRRRAVEDSAGLDAQIKELSVFPEGGDCSSLIDINDAIELELRYVVRKDLKGSNVALLIHSEYGLVYRSWDTDLNQELFAIRPAGEYTARLSLPRQFLGLGRYKVSAGIGKSHSGPIHHCDDLLAFEVEAFKTSTDHKSYDRRGCSLSYPLAWSISKS